MNLLAITVVKKSKYFFSNYISFIWNEFQIAELIRDDMYVIFYCKLWFYDMSAKYSSITKCEVLRHLFSKYRCKYLDAEPLYLGWN